MRYEHAKHIVDALNELGEYEYKIYENYSGRYMFGKTTTAIIIPNGCCFAADILRMSASFVNEDGQTLFEDLMNFKEDSFGNDTIIY